MGDPAGIGLEIILKAWVERGYRGLGAFVVYADPEAVADRARKLGLAVPIETVDRPGRAGEVFDTHLPVRPLRLPNPAVPGAPDPANAGAVIASIEEAAAAVALGEASALLTNPIAKSVLYSAGFPHAGHTEFLGRLAERLYPGREYRPVMMLVSRELRVVPLTVHIPVADVPKAITQSRIVDTARIAWEALVHDFGISNPRIAVCGLNPHAGEGGALGSEERDVIAPAIEVLKAQGLTVTGPHAADTLFHADRRRTYDAALAMYHDQALIPLKTLAFNEGVNVTLGLPFVRTSPDHGTAFDIADEGCASPESFIASVKLAQSLAAARSAARE